MQLADPLVDITASAARDHTAATGGEASASRALTAIFLRCTRARVTAGTGPTSKRVRELVAARESSDRPAAYAAFVELMKLTEKPVKWSYEVWDQMVSDLPHSEGHKRAFAAQMLARLAISGPEERILRDFPNLAADLHDDKTVTARHALQSLWRVGLGGPRQRATVIEALARRFVECGREKIGSRARTDAITSPGNLARESGYPAIAERAEKLMRSEKDEKALKQQRASWRKASA